jgi:hypothetical protein
MTLNVSSMSLDRLRSTDLSELCGQIEWSDAARDFATPNSSFTTVLQSLINHAYWIDAVSLLALALPPRASIWWGAVVCSNFLQSEVADEKTADQQQKLLAYVRQWVVEPEEGFRQSAYEAAAAMPNRVPSHWMGMAVFWATGNITPDAGVVTPPPASLYARAVSAGITIAAALSGPTRDEVFEAAVRAGIDIACGGDGQLKPDPQHG